MDEDRKHLRLRDLCDSIDYGLTASATDMPTGHRFLRITDIVRGIVDWSTVPHVDASDSDLRKYRLNPGDVVVARTGATTGYSTCILNPPDALFASYLVRFAISDRHDSRFVGYLLKGSQWWQYIHGVLGDKSAQPNASASTLANAPFDVPPLPEQRAIAEVLGALDDKIEANRRLAGSSRRLADAFATSGLGNDDGRLTDLEELAEITKGVSYRSEDLAADGGWLVSLKCVGRDGSFQPGGLKPFVGQAKSSQVVDDGDILVAQTDLSQKAEVIGRPIRVERGGSDGRLVASLDFSIVRPRPPLTREVLFGILSQRAFREHALGFCNGTTVLHMNSRAIPSYQVSVVTPEQVGGLTNLMAPLLESAADTRRETDILRTFRDVLLPKLLSGELKVRDAEKLVGESV